MTIFALLRKLILFLILPFIAGNIQAQFGGTGVFSVLKQPANGRQAAWGGYNSAYRTSDANALLCNPALLGPETDQRGSLNFNTQFKGVWSGNGAYSLKYKEVGYFGIAVSFIDYGKMDAYDAGGNAEGVTNANETVLALSFAKPVNQNFSYGANLKMAYSILGPYIGSGLMLDAGASWRKKDSVVMLGFVLRNMGAMVGTYGGGLREPLPFQAEFGLNFKPKHMPFRFNITYHDLQKFDLTYNQYLKSTTIDLSGQSTTPKSAGFPEKFIRHIVVGTELVLGKNFGIMVGYNHQRRTEMGPDIRKGVAGFSWGLNFKISKFNITYSSASYFPGFNMNLFTFSAGLTDFKKK